ncbi:unnamed protein product [Nippostrongylus brasiliensis]|uniref:Rho-GAP domain-containing protein n=1 Tax=Nippostrongylus brasiliensis TaxID=27835 RepID=A0A158QYS8_NIPBR|nr:unnamed protein product [Nippostrongylus brasiliensis]
MVNIPGEKLCSQSHHSTLWAHQRVLIEPLSKVYRLIRTVGTGESTPCPSDRTPSAGSRRSLPMLSNWIGNKSPTDSGLCKAERVRLIDRAMRAEAAATDSESKIRALELRNHDLSTEVCWLRQQCTIACPDASNVSMASFVPPICSEQCQVEKKVLQDTIAKQNADLSRLRMDVERASAVDVRKDIRISELIKEVNVAKSRIRALEELCRDQMNGVLPTPAGPSGGLQPEETTTVADKSGQDAVSADKAEDDVLQPSTSPVPLEPLKSSNSRLVSGRPRPSLRNIFTIGNDRHIDGRARPDTAIDSPSTAFTPPPFKRNETAPILKSIQVLQRTPSTTHNNSTKNEVVEVHRDDPYFEATKNRLSESEGDDSDIDIADILETSNRSTALSTRTPSGKSRDSGFCREDRFSTGYSFNKQRKQPFNLQLLLVVRDGVKAASLDEKKTAVRTFAEISFVHRMDFFGN